LRSPEVREKRKRRTVSGDNGEWKGVMMRMGGMMQEMKVVQEDPNGFNGKESDKQ
jgi:hypothetical protein